MSVQIPYCHVLLQTLISKCTSSYKIPNTIKQHLAGVLGADQQSKEYSARNNNGWNNKEEAFYTEFSNFIVSVFLQFLIFHIPVLSCDATECCLLLNNY